VLLAVVLVVAIYRTATLWSPAYPPRIWLGLRYAKAAGGAAAFVLACVSMGGLLVGKVLGLRLSIRDHFVFAFPTGMFAFFFVEFILGTLGALGRPMFFILPLAFIAAGAPYHYRRLRALRRRGVPFTFATPVWMWPALALAAMGIIALYLPTLTPTTIGYDARWYHYRLAEHYLAAGRIERFPEGWMPGALPQLASVLYLWAFQIPGDLFDRVELCEQIEFVVLLGTLPGIPAFVRAVVPKTSGAGTWAALFLFPSIYVCGVRGGSDHIAAVFTIPAVLAVFRAVRGFEPRPSLLAAVMISGWLVTKLTAASIATPIIVGVGIKATIDLVRALVARKSPLFATRGAWVMLGAGIVLTAPYWLRNAIYYRNPFYPMGKLVRNVPWHADATDIYAMWQKVEFDRFISRPTHDWAGVKQALAALVDFGSSPHDMAAHSAGLPFFGTIFTLTTAALLFVRARARLWAAFVAGHVAIFLWMWIIQQERYLQAVVPMLAACSVAVLILAWRSGIAAKILVVPLLFAQISWAVEACFVTMGTDWVAPVTTLFHAGPRSNRPTDRFSYTFAPWSDVAITLPKNSRLLVHEIHDVLGLGLPAVQDFPQWQYGLDYARLGSARAVHDQLRAYGVTHVLWQPGLSGGHDSIGGDLAFFRFVTRHLGPPRSFGMFNVAELQKNPPLPAATEELVAYWGCGETYATGLYGITDLHAGAWGPPPLEEHARPREPLPPSNAADTVIPRVSFVVHNPSCNPQLPASVVGRLSVLTTRNGYTLYFRP
jgi:hypothetical protein